MAQPARRLCCEKATATLDVALDYGFTHSGAVARCHVSCEDHSDAYRRSFDDTVIQKFPSILWYRKEDNDVKILQSGARIDNRIAFEFTKFHLLGEGEWIWEDNETASMIQEKWKNIEFLEDNISLSLAFLQGMFRMARDKFLRAYGDRRVHPTRTRAIITVPKILSGESMENLQRVANELRSSENIEVIFDYEHIAALRCFLERNDEIQLQYPQQEPFIVIDIGGLTADMTVFQPGADTAEQSLSLSKISGGAIVARRFIEKLDQKLKLKLRDDQRRTAQYKVERERVIEEWLTHSSLEFRGISPLEKLYFYVLGCRVTITSSDVIRIFRPVRKNIAEGIVELYENVQGQKPRVVILTGGLSSSVRLHEAIKFDMRSRQHDFMVVTLPNRNEAWNAVALGAAAYHDPKYAHLTTPQTVFGIDQVEAEGSI